ncbi:MAG: DUF1232 domain-containing protein [Salinarimonadaceae bacterium]|nr:MAG: DUF1232 domain-containing protein [Salinarimonadaceae bacterium]
MRLRETAKRIMIDMRLTLRMLADPRTPVRARVALVFAALYVVFPFDLIPDYRPIYGLFDDIVVAAIAIAFALRLIPREVREQYRPPPPANDNGDAPRVGALSALIAALAGVILLTLAAWWIYGLLAA